MCLAWCWRWLCVCVWWGIGVFRQNMPTTTILGGLSVQESKTTIGTPIPSSLHHPCHCPPQKTKHICIACSRPHWFRQACFGVVAEHTRHYRGAHSRSAGEPRNFGFLVFGCHCSMVMGSGCVLSLCLALWWLCNGGEWCSIKACPGFSSAVST